MGGQAYLTRLALGRSAYETVDGLQIESVQNPSGGDTQQYDAKGHPINPLTTVLNETQIQAKNEVLEAVGVCERKNKKLQESKCRNVKVILSVDAWTAICEAENDVGSDDNLAADLAHLAFTWWLSTIQRRIQTHLIDFHQPFTSILSGEWHRTISHGVVQSIRNLSAGATSEAMTHIAISWAEDYFQFMFAGIRSRIRRLSLTSRTKSVLLHHTSSLSNVAMTLFELGISPLPLFSCLEQLGLYSSRYGTPPLTSFLPWHESSPLIWAWSSGDELAPLSHRLFELTTSPVSLWLSYTVLRHYIDVRSSDTSLGEKTFPHPVILEDSIEENLREQFVPWSLRSFMPLLLRPASVVGAGAGAGAGGAYTSSNTSTAANPQTRSRARTRAEMRAREEAKAREEADNAPRAYRLTLLSTLTSKVLSLRVHSLIWQIALLPLESILFRSVAASFLRSSYARTLALQNGTAAAADPSLLLAQTQGLSSPLGAGSLFRFLRGESMSGFGAYASKVGLCIAFQAAVDAVILGVTYIRARRTGINRFHWGVT